MDRGNLTPGQAEGNGQKFERYERFLDTDTLSSKPGITPDRDLDAAKNICY